MTGEFVEDVVGIGIAMSIKTLLTLFELYIEFPFIYGSLTLGDCAKQQKGAE